MPMVAVDQGAMVAATMVGHHVQPTDALSRNLGMLSVSLFRVQMLACLIILFV